MNPALRAVVFDAYGTLFDVYAVGPAAERLFPGHGAALAALWRDKQIEYTRLRTLCDRYASFWDVTQDALVFAARKLGLALEQGARTELLAQYRRLPAFPENAAALQRLRALGLPLAILSNANTDMLAGAVASAGLEGYFGQLLSADRVRRFKTAPEVYRLGPEAFGCAAGEILFVSSNGWDVAGATWFGYTTFWVNRGGQPAEELGVAACGEGRSLEDVVGFAAARVPGAAY